MKKEFKVGDKVKHTDFFSYIGKIVEIDTKVIVIQWESKDQDDLSYYHKSDIVIYRPTKLEEALC